MSNATERAYETIRNAILEGTFPPTARLKETELVAYCRVSRTPVREALRRLAAEDFVVIQRNQGARVKSWSAEDLDELFSLRALLEGHAAARAASRISQPELAGIAGSVQEMSKVLGRSMSQKNKTTEFLRLNSKLHEAIWLASGSERLVSMLRQLVEQALTAHTAAQFSLERVAQSHHHHEELLQALSAGDPAWAEAVMRNHIHAARHALAPTIAATPDQQ
ncbi:MAG: GntR family transcriptional regulator [Gammaproteobacteria bacterium]|nr:GntR family transcriptional regulator [Gammaproteobacteria bacterium]